MGESTKYNKNCEKCDILDSILISNTSLRGDRELSEINEIAYKKWIEIRGNDKTWEEHVETYNRIRKEAEIEYRKEKMSKK